MTEFEVIVLVFIMFVQGLVIGYIKWAPNTAFKRGLVDGLTLKFIWKKVVK